MLKPLEDHVVVEPIVQEEKTSSGIYLPDTAHKDKPQTGKVVAVGIGRLMDNGTRVASEVQVGETVVFAKYAGSDVQLSGKDYIILKNSDILAILEETKAAEPVAAPVKKAPAKKAPVKKAPVKKTAAKTTRKIGK